VEDDCSNVLPSIPLPEDSGSADPLQAAHRPVGTLAHAPSTSQEHTPRMLDVHAPHAAAHTWKDFLIHIAAIAIGLLIAVGLEQSVEFFHHRHQVAETREALRVEREQNHTRFADQLTEFHRRIPVVESNLAVFHYLRLHPGTHEKDLPGKVSWHNIGVSFIDYAWQSAQQTGVTAHMPQDEVRRNADLYRRLKTCADSYAAFRVANTEARTYTVDDADVSHLTVVQIDEQIRLTMILLNRLYRYGSDLRSLSITNPDFSPAPSLEEIAAIVHESVDERGELEESAKHLRSINGVSESLTVPDEK
jgi:hypothetical protein